MPAEKQSEDNATNLSDQQELHHHPSPDAPDFDPEERELPGQYGCQHYGLLGIGIRRYPDSTPISTNIGQLNVFGAN